MPLPQWYQVPPGQVSYGVGYTQILPSGQVTTFQQQAPQPVIGPMGTVVSQSLMPPSPPQAYGSPGAALQINAMAPPMMPFSPRGAAMPGGGQGFAVSPPMGAPAAPPAFLPPPRFIMPPLAGGPSVDETLAQPFGIPGRVPPERLGAPPPWTQMDLQVEVVGSDTAQEAIDANKIQGRNIVRGLFNGRFRGFISSREF